MTKKTIDAAEDLIFEYAHKYIQKNKKDFFDYYDILIKAVARGIKNTLELFTNRDEIFKEIKIESEANELHNKIMNKGLDEFKSTLPGYAALLNKEINGAYKAGADSCMIAIGKLYQGCNGCEDCADKESCEIQKHINEKETTNAKSESTN